MVLLGYLYIDQFTCNCLFHPHSDAVHTEDPLHLVFGFELLGHALARGVLFHQQIEHLIGGAVDFLQVCVQLPGQQHSGVDAVVMLPQEIPAPHAPNPNPGSLRQL